MSQKKREQKKRTINVVQKMDKNIYKIKKDLQPTYTKRESQEPIWSQGTTRKKENMQAKNKENSLTNKNLIKGHNRKKLT